MPWASSQLPDLSSRHALVTGANSGIGFHTAAELARHGATVTMACRNLSLAEPAAAKIRAGGTRQVRVALLDLSSLESVRSFAESWDGPLDILVNNAGVMAPPHYRETLDGHELQFGTNHLAHFALTGRLLPALRRAESGRVVTVSSVAHHRGRPGVVDGNPRTAYRPESSYGNSKLANLLFAFELERRAEAAHSTVTSAAAHPGVAATGLVPDGDGMGARPLVRFLAPLVLKVIFQSAAAGANPSLFAATEAVPGSYTGPQWLHESRGPVGPARPSDYATDEALAARLWEVSERLTAVSYDWDG